MLCNAVQQLGEEWSVFMNPTFQTESFSGEGDAFLYHNEYGLFIIEVKAGRLSAKGDSWCQSGRKMSESPIAQVSRLAYKVRLALNSKFHDQYGGRLIRDVPMVCFPEMADRGQIAETAAPSSMVILKGDVCDPNRLQEKLIARANSLTYPNGDRIEHRRLTPPEEQEKLRNFLCGESRVAAEEIWKAQSRARWDVQSYMRVFAEALHSNKTLAVDGVAGSGKTKMAEWEMELFLEKEHKKVAYACYNILLARHIATRHGANRNGQPQVHEFHGWADWIVEKTQLGRKELGEYQAKIEKNENKNECYKGIERLMGQIVGHLDEKDKFDALFIDEGQDLNKSQTAILLGLLKPDGFFRIFQDENQDIRLHDKDVSENNETLEKRLRQKTFVKLNRSYRNTKEILKWVKWNTGMDIPPYETMPYGDKVTSVLYNSDEDLVKKISQEMEFLQNSQSITPGEIMMVSLASEPRFMERLKKVKSDSNLVIPNCLLFPKERFENESQAELHSIFRVKGLERNCVFLLDNDDQMRQDETRYKRLLATAATRARSHLIVFRKAGASG